MKPYRKILIITVGGSDEPLVSSIKAHNPDYIYFICSGGESPAASNRTVDGPGNVCIRKKEIKCRKCGNVLQNQEAYPSIIVQSSYTRKFKKVVLNDPDDFSEVYSKTKDVLKEAERKGKEIIADFTGGTKTMSSVLAILTAFHFNIKPSLVKGIRTDIEKIKSDSWVMSENFECARVDCILKIVNSFLLRHLYFPALLLLQEISLIGVSGETQRKVREMCSIINAFHYWDSFNYDTAFEKLKNFADIYPAPFKYLLKILGKNKNSGYEKVFDLIANAERQANNGFYDNAVARIYRALELFAQIRLKTAYNIDTSQLEKALPRFAEKINTQKWMKLTNEEGEIKIGLKNAYELLKELGDVIGKVYETKKEQFLENLKLRNESKLAHGDIPVEENGWKRILDFCKIFLEECCAKIGITIQYPEFPTISF